MDGRSAGREEELGKEQKLKLKFEKKQFVRLFEINRMMLSGGFRASWLAGRFRGLRAFEVVFLRLDAAWVG